MKQQKIKVDSLKSGIYKDGMVKALEDAELIISKK